MIRMMIADMLDELGHTVVAEAGNIYSALRLAETSEFDIAILDINVGGERTDPVAKLIDSRRIPFVFASGYGAAGAPENFRDRPVLQKPFPIEHLRDTVEPTIKGRLL